jgi:hypothetical protein
MKIDENIIIVHWNINGEELEVGFFFDCPAMS